MRSTATAAPPTRQPLPASMGYRLTEGARRAWKRNRAGYMFLLPWLVGFFFLTLGPTLASLWLSFTNFDGVPSIIAPTSRPRDCACRGHAAKVTA